MSDERIHGGPDWSRAGFGQIKDPAPQPDPRDAEIARLRAALAMAADDLRYAAEKVRTVRAQQTLIAAEQDARAALAHP
jgi:hypothetical protein